MSERLAWTGLVLASGRSRRFGGLDKACLPLAGRTLLQRALDALAPVTITTLVVGPRVYGAVRCVPDEDSDGGPVAGLRTGLRAMTTTHALAIACDLPFLTPPFLEALRDLGTSALLAVVPRADGRVPLCLSIRRQALAVVDDYWREGGRSLRGLVTRLAPVVMPAAIRDRHDADGVRLLNVNDPLTYARALAEAQHDCRASYFTDLDESKHTP